MQLRSINDKKARRYPSLVRHNVRGFALPMVMLLGIALTLVLGSLISRSNNSDNILTNRANTFEEQQHLQYAQDAAITDFLGHLAANGTTTVASQNINACFDYLNAAHTFAYVGTSTLNDETTHYSIRQVKRSGHALNINTNTDFVTLDSLGVTGFDDNFLIDVWFKINTINPLDLLVTPADEVLLTLTSVNSNTAQIRLMGDTNTAFNVSVDTWYYLLFEAQNGTYTLRVGEQSIPQPVSKSSQTAAFPAGDWTFAKGTADIDIAAIRVWRGYATPFDVDGQYTLDKTTPGSMSQSPLIALVLDAESGTDLTAQWQRAVGRASVSSIELAPFTINYNASGGLLGRHAPPAPSEHYILDICYGDATEQHRFTITRDAVLGSYEWQK